MNATETRTIEDGKREQVRDRARLVVATILAVALLALGAGLGISLGLSASSSGAAVSSCPQTWCPPAAP
jgi:hypothetical protein